MLYSRACFSITRRTIVLFDETELRKYQSFIGLKRILQSLKYWRLFKIQIIANVTVHIVILDTRMQRTIPMQIPHQCQHIQDSNIFVKSTALYYCLIIRFVCWIRDKSNSLNVFKNNFSDRKIEQKRMKLMKNHVSDRILLIFQDIVNIFCTSFLYYLKLSFMNHII